MQYANFMWKVLPFPFPLRIHHKCKRIFHMGKDATYSVRRIQARFGHICLICCRIYQCLKNNRKGFISFEIYHLEDWEHPLWWSICLQLTTIFFYNFDPFRMEVSSDWPINTTKSSKVFLIARLVEV